MIANLCPNTTGTTTGSIGDYFKSFKPTDPSTDLCSVVQFLLSVIGIALDLGGIIAVIMIMYSAFLYMNTNGEETKAETAKKTLLWSIGGVAIIIMAKVIIAWVQIKFDH